MAKLDAEAGAPAPVTELLFSLSRIEPWRPKRPARYIVSYARKIDVREALTGELEVDGRIRPLRVETARAASERQVRQVASIVIVGICVAVLLAAITTALNRRSVGEASLKSAEAAAQADAARARLANEADRQRRIVAQAGLAGSEMSNALADLNILARRRSSNAAISSVSWAPGEVRLETRTLAAPLPDARKLGRSPEHGNLFLWGLTSPRAAAGRP